MADAYNVRTNGQRYYVYRLDGNVPVSEYFGDGAAAKAQREAAIRNQQHNEKFGKKKEAHEQSLVPHTEGWVEGGDEPETTVGHPDHLPQDVRPSVNEEPQPETTAEQGSREETPASDQPAPGTGVTYKVPQRKQTKSSKKKK